MKRIFAYGISEIQPLSLTWTRNLAVDLSWCILGADRTRHGARLAAVIEISARRTAAGGRRNLSPYARTGEVPLRIQILTRRLQDLADRAARKGKCSCAIAVQARCCSLTIKFRNFTWRDQKQGQCRPEKADRSYGSDEFDARVLYAEQTIPS
ncbi:hypothetical protein XI06_24780 [Bradyrhizobium sp. CCBAU 11434]|uniref:hypothetical protein n=1 Tax=Bradyrhizobium sp. CCBAU 11434 TaxID=1630885 RepID=UPI002304E032|nr:hypothetical protein [Bradyrhizobium sp. CCBAU 11434]MDA9523408.1 hypothetical protein [Bradyrhizobium sp. CCBAU 11434]